MTKGMMKRRTLLRLAASGGMATALYPFGSVRVLGQDAPFSDYRCLVNLFLFGGNDSFNLVIPRSEAEYNVYAQSRQNLALAREDLLPIFPSTTDGMEYGVHPSAGGLQTLFNSGQACIIANVGPLIAPVTKDDFLNGSSSIPPRLFSHNDQQDQWQTLKGRDNLVSGWAGRIADVISAATDQQTLPLNVSTAGTNLFQSGQDTVPYTISEEGADAYGALEDSVTLGTERRQAFQDYLAGGFPSVHARALAEVHQRSLDRADRVNEALALVPDLDTPFPASSLGAQLKIIARMIAVKDEFRMSRQIFFAAAGGFDTHDDQNALQPGLIANVTDSLAAFQTAMVEIGMADQVVTFTQSDFGRTLTSNGDGTDHGWGGHQLVTGNPVAGGEIYGRMPVLEIGGEDDATGGRIIPSLSADQYAATLARWFGVEESDIRLIAPNLENFAVQDLGFLG